MAITMCKGDFQDTSGYSPTGCTHETTFEGAVLETRERNGYDDSDFYAIVWDGEKITTVDYASTRFWTYHNTAEVDATDSVKAAARAWLRKHAARQYELSQRSRAASHGDTVRVTKGRKVPVGTEGKVFWIGEKRWGTRVGFKDADGEAHWTAADNVEVIHDEDELAEKAAAYGERAANSDNWKLATALPRGYARL